MQETGRSARHADRLGLAAATAFMTVLAGCSAPKEQGPQASLSTRAMELQARCQDGTEADAGLPGPASLAAPRVPGRHAQLASRVPSLKGYRYQSVGLTPVLDPAPG